MTPFASILRRAVERTPNAIGGAFADAEGEMVDSFGTGDTFELAVMTAHYGIVMQQLIAAFGTWHYGGPEYFVADHARMEVLVYNVDSGYYVLIASRQPALLAVALESIRSAARQLKKEMGI